MVLPGPAWAPVKGNPRMPVSSDASLATWAGARLPPGFLVVSWSSLCVRHSLARCLHEQLLKGPPSLNASNVLLSLHAVLGGQSESKYTCPVCPASETGKPQPSWHCSWRVRGLARQAAGFCPGHLEHRGAGFAVVLTLIRQGEQPRVWSRCFPGLTSCSLSGSGLWVGHRAAAPTGLGHRGSSLLGRAKGAWRQRPEGTHALPRQPAAPSGTVGDVTMPGLPLLPAWQEGTQGRPQLFSGTSEETWGMCH